MRDISHKIKTLRTATAMATLKMPPHIIEAVKNDTAPKGNPLPIAKVAAIQSAKDTSRIIPYCHPLPVDYVGVDFDLKDNAIDVTVTIKVIYKTGVEIEAMTAASVAALTLYDMLKMLDDENEMEIAGVKLLSKKGGKSDFKFGIASQLKTAVVVISDSVSAGTKEDTAGKLIVDRLENYTVESLEYKIISDDTDGIVETVKTLSDKDNIDLIITTGGTGLSPRDNTPEAMKQIIERDIPGMAEVMRDYGQERTPYAMLSRGQVGLRGKTLIINLPGSSNGVRESLDALFPAVFHGFKILRGGGHHDERSSAKQSAEKALEPA